MHALGNMLLLDISCCNLHVKMLTGVEDKEKRKGKRTELLIGKRDCHAMHVCIRKYGDFEIGTFIQMVEENSFPFALQSRAPELMAGSLI